MPPSAPDVPGAERDRPVDRPLAGGGFDAQALLERLGDAVFALDSEGRFVYANPAAEKVLARERAALLGSTLRDVLPGAAQAPLVQAWREVARGRVLARCPDWSPVGGRCFDARLFPFFDGVSVWLHDVTEEREHRLERERLLAAERRSREAAEREARVRGEAVEMVSHDLRNPLSAVMLNCELLEEITAEDDPRRERIQRVLRAANQMKTLVEGILNTRRLEAGFGVPVELRPIDGSALLRDACALFAAKVEAANLQLRCDAPEGPLRICADRERLLQVLWNLIDNAIKFSPHGGRVRVRAIPVGPRVRFSVQDSGPGVPPEALPHLFDPFWQDKRSARLGSGLGLPISRAIVKSHGGDLRVESGVGEGTTFAFEVPAECAR